MGSIIFLAYNLLISAAIFSIYLLYTKKIQKRMIHNRQKTFVLYILIIHIGFSVFFWVTSLYTNSDARGYYNTALDAENWFEFLGMGSSFMKFIIYPFIKARVSYFNINMLFSIFSFLAFNKLYLLFIEQIDDKEKKSHWGVAALLLMPTFHFFTAGISKDNLVFFLLITFFTFISNKRKFDYKYIILLLLLFLIRPHILLFLLTSFFIIKFVFGKVKLLTKIAVFILFTAIIIILEPIISEKLGVSVFSLESIERTFDRIESYGKRKSFGGSTIDSSNMNIFQKMLTYSYTPLIWKSDTLFKHLISLENFLLVFILIQSLLKKGKIKFLRKSKPFVKVMFLYSIITWVLLSFTLYNLGLSTRQKYMYIPFLYFVIFLKLQERKTLRND